MTMNEQMVLDDLDSCGQPGTFVMSSGLYSFLWQQPHRDDPETDVYFFHSDHLGSTSYITAFDGTPYQHVEYLPFGEVLLEEKAGTWQSPYKFNCKELDDESGLYYYGARYYSGKWGIWLGVDPMSDKYPGWSPYVYTLDKPIILIDREGMQPEIPEGDPKKSPTQTSQVLPVPENTVIGTSYLITGIEVTEKSISHLLVKDDGKISISTKVSSNPAGEILASGLMAAIYISQFDGPIIGPADQLAMTYAASTIITAALVYAGYEIYTFGKGRTKNERKINPDAKHVAERKVKELEQKLENAKTNSEKEEIKRQIQHWREKANKKSEPHGRGSGRH